MKPSLALAFAISAIGGFLGLLNHHRITTAEASLRELLRKSAAADALADSSGDATPANRGRHGNLTADVRTIAVDLIRFARELEEKEHAGDASSLLLREQQILDWQKKLSALDPSLMEPFLREIENAGLGDSLRLELLAISLTAFSETQPRTVLGLINDPLLAEAPQFRLTLTATALSKVMITDPDAAISWYKENIGDFSGVDTEKIRGGVLRRLGERNPALAFSLIRELGFPNPSEAVSIITFRQEDNDRRADCLNAFRQFMAGIPAGANREEILFEGNSTLMRDAFFMGTENAIRWIGENGFSPDEIKEFGARVYFISAKDAGPYVDWLVRSIPDQKSAAEVISQHFFDWTRADHEAAREWVERQPEGEVRNRMTGSYAHAISSLDPAEAARLIESLPAETRARHTLEEIQRQWARKDPAAADAFAEKHGLR